MDGLGSTASTYAPTVLSVLGGRGEMGVHHRSGGGGVCCACTEGTTDTVPSTREVPCSQVTNGD